MAPARPQATAELRIEEHTARSTTLADWATGLTALFNAAAPPPRAMAGSGIEAEEAAVRTDLLREALGQGWYTDPKSPVIRVCAPATIKQCVRCQRIPRLRFKYLAEKIVQCLGVNRFGGAEDP